MIPKIIHVTWFGDAPFPPLVIKCMKSWKRYLPDYQIMIWTKDNYDLDTNAWVKEAYAAKKYAFVSDFARFDVLYRFGGIYLDSDVEILKKFDLLLDNKAFAGFMSIPNIIEAEVIGSEKGHPFMHQMMEYYANRHFIKSSGELDLTELPIILYKMLSASSAITDESEQIVSDVHLYPPGIFTYHGDFLVQSPIWSEIYSYHYGAGIGWRNKKQGLLAIFIRVLQHNSLRIIRIFNMFHIFKLYPKLWALYSKLMH